MTFKRLMPVPKTSFFLFGPRATGKTTWLREQIKYDFYIDLLTSKDFLRYSNHPEELGQLLEGNPDWRCIVIDEIQKLPSLLDEIHALMFKTKEKVQFVLTGSSARKIKRSNANLLAGRALMRKFHPLRATELKDYFNLDTALKFGLLPKIWNLNSHEERSDYLYSYVDTYLKEEIQQEALTRNLPSYTLFLEHMALRNSQVLNLQNVSQQVGVARNTVQGYLEILEDTMLGMRLPPIQLKAKVKEVATPKFYFFDCGVVNALTSTLSQKMIDPGHLLETYVLHELTSFADSTMKRWKFSYWATPTESEVDFIVSSGNTNIGIEVKSTTSWKKEHSRGLKILLDAKKIKRAYGVYRGEHIIKKDGALIIPSHLFSNYLVENDLFDLGR